MSQAQRDFINTTKMVIYNTKRSIHWWEVSSCIFMEASATIVETWYVKQANVCITKQTHQSHSKTEHSVAFNFYFRSDKYGCKTSPRPWPISAHHLTLVLSSLSDPWTDPTASTRLTKKTSDCQSMQTILHQACEQANRPLDSDAMSLTSKKGASTPQNSKIRSPRLREK